MIDEIFIKVKDNGEVQAENYVLTMENENDSKGFVVTLPEKISSYSIYVEFEKSNGKTLTSKRLLSEQNIIKYDLGKNILDCAGILKVQFIARNDSGLSWKSDTANFIIKKSINATEQVVGVSGDIVSDLQAQLDGKQDLLVAGRNIELQRQGEKVLISVPDTAIGLTEDEVQEQIEENLVGIEQEVELAKESAIEAKEISVGAKNTVNSVKTQLNATEELANEANENAKNALENSNQANDTANNAYQVAEEAKQIADNIDEVASNALSVASNTLATATEAKTIATQTQSIFETFKEETDKSLVELEESKSEATNIENGTGAFAVQQKGTTASGSRARSNGYGTKATGNYQGVDGAFNAEDLEAYYIVGNGGSDKTRKNAFVVKKDGRAQVQSTPTEETDVVRKKELDGKLDKVTMGTAGNHVYGIRSGNVQTVFPLATHEWDMGLKSTVVRRDEYGQASIETPTSNKHIANKKYVDDTITQKIAETVANAPESFDTLEEIAKWIEEHPESVAELNAQIQANKTAIDGKLDKHYAKGAVYATDYAGNQIVISYDSVIPPDVWGSIILRDSNGRAQVNEPVEDLDIANKHFVKTQIETNKIALENGESAGSIQQVLYEDDTRKGSNAHGKYGVALNQNTNSYQRCATSTGLATQAGLTYEEFLAKYPDGVDEHGYDYEKSNSAAFSSGQETKSRGRGAFTGGGYKNEVDGDYSGSVGGGGNKVKGEYSGTLGGYGNEITEEASKSSVFDGYNNKISGENSGVGGSNNVVEVDNSHALGSGLVLDKEHGHNRTAVGKYNDKKSYAIYQVGAGTSDEDRKNAFEVFEDGTVQTLKGKLLNESEFSLENGVGKNSVKMKGYDGEVTGEGSVLVGGNRYDHEDGDREAILQGKQSFNAGGGNQTYGDFNVTLGKESVTYQKVSMAFGGDCVSGMTEEEWNEANPSGTDMWGKAYPSYSFATAFGVGSAAKGSASMAVNSNTKALGTFSFAANYNNTASGEASSAFGRANTASGGSAFVIGGGNTASGENSFAGGWRSSASGYFGLAHGRAVNSKAEAQAVLGRYNADNNKALFIVGNGKSAEEAGTTTDQLSNAFEVTKDASVMVGGNRFDHEDGDLEAVLQGRQSFNVGGGNQVYGDWNTALGKANQTYQRGSFSSGGGNKAGLTETEFLQRYPDGVDESGKSYDGSYSYAVAMGEQNNAHGRDSGAFGANTLANEHASFASGYYSRTYGKYGFTANFYNTAVAEASSAFGQWNTAKEEHVAAFVTGQQNNSSAPHQLIGGHYCADDPDALNIIGNGINNDNRSNAFVVKKDGRAQVQTAPKEDIDVLRKEEIKSLILPLVYPVGSIYMSDSESNNPNNWENAPAWTWERIENKYLVAQGSDFDVTDGEHTGGSNSLTLKTENLPSHSHTINHSHNVSVDSMANSGYTTRGGVVFRNTDQNLSLVVNTSGIADELTGDTAGFKSVGQSLLVDASGGGFEFNVDHTHNAKTSSISTTNSGSTGSGKAVEIKPAYYVVYVWKRVA